MNASAVYLDHAATTPMREPVAAAVADQFRTPGNPSSLHTAGRNARRVVEEAREQIAAGLGARPSEVIFTSGGTEADNLAVIGTFEARRSADPRRTRLIVGATEHHAVLDAVEFLVAQRGASVDWIEVDGQGRHDPAVVADLIERNPEDIALVSMMWANNEVGTVQPVAQVAAIAREAGVPFHTDAVQAAGQLPVDFAASGADLMAIAAHKLGGPTGVGALVARRDAVLQPGTFGGGQERGLRSGTLDVAGIRGFGVAVAETVATLDTHRKHLVGLRDRLIEEALALDLGVEVSGIHLIGDADQRLAGNAHLRVPGCDGDSLLYLLDAAGVQCSTGSACQAGVPRPSHVLLAMGIPDSGARGALRLTLGHTSTDADVDRFLEVLPSCVERAQRAGQVA